MHQSIITIFLLSYIGIGISAKNPVSVTLLSRTSTCAVQGNIIVSQSANPSILEAENTKNLDFKSQNCFYEAICPISGQVLLKTKMLPKSKKENFTSLQSFKSVVRTQQLKTTTH